jgi:hypothetical protein
VKPQTVVVALPLIIAAIILQPTKSFCQVLPVGDEVPPYLRDRGMGIPMSQLGTYVRHGELLFYPFYEYYYDHNLEYKPSDFGYGSDDDFRGRYRAHEGLIFLGYGFSDKLAMEFEAAVISAELEKAQDDLSGMPPKLKESGLGDVEGQIRWRWNHESAKTPEYFSFVETVFPTSKKNSLIGTPNWEFAFQTGLIKGFRWGTVTPHVGVEYSVEEKTAVFAFALEYLKKVSNHFRFFTMLEGTQDEASVIPEIQWHFSRHAFLKVNNGLGLTSKAIDMAPEIGIMFAEK